MRPVEKKKPGDTVRYLNSNNQVVVHTLQEHYPHYRDALFPLMGKVISVPIALIVSNRKRSM